MATRAVSTGRCQFCGGEYGKSGMTRHLQACQARREASVKATGTRTRSARSLHLAVSGRTAPTYWMHLEAPENATLADLDAFLREAWLECCGHLSSFTVGGVSYASVVDRDWGMDDRSMDVKLGTVLHVGDTFYHDYDFGSTTYLQLKVVGEREGAARDRSIEELARNEPPHIPCTECGQEAAQVCTECSWGGEGWLCERCSETHQCGEEMLLPVVNSPRVGTCGYTG